MPLIDKDHFWLNYWIKQGYKILPCDGVVWFTDIWVCSAMAFVAPDCITLSDFQTGLFITLVQLLSMIGLFALDTPPP